MTHGPEGANDVIERTYRAVPLPAQLHPPDDADLASEAAERERRILALAARVAREEAAALALNPSHHRRRPWTDDELSSAIAAYLAGDTVKGIATRGRRSESSVSVRLRRAGVRIRPSNRKGVA